MNPYTLYLQNSTEMKIENWELNWKQELVFENDTKACPKFYPFCFYDSKLILTTGVV